jgi:hypothetical protein
MDVKNFVSDYLESKYDFPHVFITEGCCKRCLRGTPTKYNLKETTFKALMEGGKMEPHQAANCFCCSKFRPGSFANELINVHSDPKPCKYPRNCHLTCIVCRALVEGEEGAELPDVWPGFTAHKKCLSRCAQPCCGKLLPALPIYMYPQRSELKCDAHKDRPKKPPMQAPRANQSIYQAPKPTRLPQPSPEPRAEPGVKKTATFKKAVSNAPKAKADKYDEKGKSRNILAFFHAPTKKKEEEQEVAQAVMQSAKEDPPRRFIRNSKTQEIFGYWQGDCAYHIETGQPLANFNKKPSSYAPPSAKLDFTPPITLASAAEAKAAEAKAASMTSITSSPIEEEQNKGESGA